MMLIHLQLYSIFREKLPAESLGRVDLEMEAGTTLSDLLDEFGITRRVVISLNGEHETDRSRELEEDDEIKLFSSISGG